MSFPDSNDIPLKKRISFFNVTEWTLEIHNSSIFKRKQNVFSKVEKNNELKSIFVFFGFSVFGIFNSLKFFFIRKFIPPPYFINASVTSHADII